jgi:sulfoxide reductase heme-binding subunit YedZ
VRGAVNGWPIVGWATVAIAVMIAACLAAAGTDEPAIRMVIRATARSSVVLFTLAFAASSLRRAWPNATTRWLLANRRQLGVSFAVSHYAHLAALLALAGWSTAGLYETAGPVLLIFVGVGYVFLTLMTLTSFDRTAAWLGPQAWCRLHTIGAYYIWFIFALSYVPRTFESALYWPLALLVIAALVLRLWSPALARRRATAETPAQAV